MPPSAPHLCAAVAARRALDALRGLGLAIGCATALNPQPLKAQAPPHSVQELEAFTAAKELESFIPTTTIRVQVNAVVGALRYQGSAVDAGANTAAGFPLLNAFTVNHDARLTIDTSFTGQDLFRVRLRSGNFGPSGFFSNSPTPLSRLDFAFEEPLCRADDASCSRNLVTVNRAYLQIPLGPEIRLTAGSRLMQLDLLPVWPSVANDSPILELFQRAGAAGAYSRRVGAGFGAWWQPTGRLRGLSIAYGAVAPLAENGSPGEGGLFSAAGGQTNTVQMAYTRPRWNLTAAYTRNGQRALLRGTPLASQLAADCRDGAIHSWSLAGYWQPANAGWIPSISAGWGLDRFAFATTPVAGLTGVRTTSWSVGLSWSDVFSSGNSVTLAVGAPAHVSRLQGVEAVDDSGMALEASSLIPITDTFSLTPAVFWLSRPRGAMGATTSLTEALGPGRGPAASLGVWGGLVRATLRF